MLEEREPINIDKDNFNEVLKEQKIKLNLAVPNKISGEPDDELSVQLNFESIKDFGPEAVAQKTPELKKLLELREALTALKGPLSNIPEFRKKVQDLVKDEAAREQVLKELGVEE
jgi:type VI secretion system protein ImpB